MSEVVFSGFPEAGLQFLEALTQNNNKAWFEAHKEAYRSHVLEPAISFVTALGMRLQAISPHICVDPRTSGSGVLMRIYRDTRFSQDKTPYKTNVSGLFWQGSGKKTEHPAFGFQLDQEGMRLMAGQFVFSKAQLLAYRNAVMDDQLGLRLLDATTAVTQSGNYEIMGQHYKRIPQGYDAAHKRASWLLYNGLYAHPGRFIGLETVTTPEIVDICMQHFRKMAPVQQWLVTVL